MTRYCFDTDVISTMFRSQPPLSLVRRVAAVPPEEQCTTSITVGELLYGAARLDRELLVAKVRSLIDYAAHVFPFDQAAAEVYGPLRARLESEGRRLAEADLRIAAIALHHDLTLVTGNVRHFGRVPGLRVENWLEAAT